MHLHIVLMLHISGQLDHATCWRVHIGGKKPDLFFFATYSEQGARHCSDLNRMLGRKVQLGSDIATREHRQSVLLPVESA